MERVVVGRLARVVGERRLDRDPAHRRRHHRRHHHNHRPHYLDLHRGLAGPGAELGEYVGLVEEEDDARVQEHLAVGHHVEQLQKFIKFSQQKSSFVLEGICTIKGYHNYR